MINLQAISWDNYVAVYQLQAEEHQKSYLSPNYASLAEAYLELACGEDGVPFVMFALCNWWARNFKRRTMQGGCTLFVRYA